MTHSLIQRFATVAGATVIALCVNVALAVGTSQWVQTSENDFKDGTFDNVVATNLGDLKLSRAVKTLLEQDPKISSVNALAEGPDGTIYAGTGPHGVVMRIKGDDVKQILALNDESYVFSLAFDKENRLLIGTGGDAGRVLRLDKPVEGQKPTEIFKAEGVQYVWTVRVTPDGNIYAATGPTGQLYEIKPDGKTRVLLDSNENNLLSLIADPTGDFLYVGTDPNGLVYRVNRKTGESFVLYDAAESEISALALDAHGNLYAATAESHDEQGQAQAAAAADQVGRPEGSEVGVPLPSEPPKNPEPPKLPDPTPGQPSPIPKVAPATPTPQNPRGTTGTALPAAQSRAAIGLGEAPPPGGDAPTPPGGAPAPTPGPNPNPNPTPSPNPQPGNPAPNASAEAGAPAGRQPPVAPQNAGQPRPEGNAVYRIDKDGFVSEVFRAPVLILGIAERQGTLLLATGSEGNLYQVNPAAEETVVMAKVQAKQVLSILPATDGRVYLGLANSGGIAAMSPGFASGGTYTSTVLDAQQVSRFGKMQLRGLLPESTGLTVATRSGNVKDATSEKSWSPWSAETPAQEFVPVLAPSARFLQYRLTFSSKAVQASPVVEDVTISYQLPNLPPQVKSIRITTANDNAQQQQANAAGGGVDLAEASRIPSARKQTIAWEAADQNGDAVSYSLYFRRGGANATWILLKEKLHESTFEWDTRSVADGRYEIKVVASDAASNPPGKGKSGTRVSDPVLVDNTPPVVGDVKWAEKRNGLEVKLKVVDRSSTVAALDYSVDSNRDWQAVLPDDEIFDSPEETVTLNLPGLAPGPHQVTVRATDARGNQAFENVMVTAQGAAASAK